MAYKLVWEPKGVTKVFSGVVTYEDLMHSSDKVEGNERFEELRFIIYDMLGTTGLGVEDFAAVDAAAAIYNDKIRAAVVATSNEVIAAAHAYMNSPFNAYKFQIFATVAEARTWLGLEPTNPL